MGIWDRELRALRDSVVACRECPRATLDCRAEPLLHRESEYRIPILFVMEAPSEKDTCRPGVKTTTVGDAQGFDQTAKNLVELLTDERALGLQSEHDVLLTNAVLCLPASKKRDGSMTKSASHPVRAFHREACNKWLAALINAASPRVVVTLGTKALEAAMRIDNLRLPAISKCVRGDYEWFGRTLVPLFHPGPKPRVAPNGRSADQQRQDFRWLRARFVR
jgi:uracil-DNA glycosylase